MQAVTQIQKLGSNLGVSIPPAIADEFSLREGLYVNVHGNGNMIVIETVKPRSTYTLNDMLSKITESNTHRCVETGEPVGNEIW